ncbi:myelin-oligodendrocyte glycoprotein-like [Brachyhypopomus gauderio]|uniref:myelin-oligodendrocyte glycoprotein-like n=1 Tax=Brachyhypopomus gauderio TaxID=698409 RepID=UPI0040430913
MSFGMKLVCVSFLLSSLFMVSTSEDVKVVGPDATIFVNAGEDLVLPCSLQPNISAVNMRVEWSRPDLTETDRFVHLYVDYKDWTDWQSESYRGRTGLFKEELQKGNTSLKLSAVQPSDDGLYNCFIRSSGWYDDATLYVAVKDKGFHTWKIAVICISVFGLGLIAFAVYILKGPTRPYNGLQDPTARPYNGLQDPPARPYNRLQDQPARPCNGLQDPPVLVIDYRTHQQDPVMDYRTHQQDPVMGYRTHQQDLIMAYRTHQTL